MSVNNATILGGPALVRYRGASFYSRGPITLTPAKETFAIEVDRFGKVDERVSNEELKVSFDPAGEWENLSILWPYAGTLLGSLITPRSQLVTGLDILTNIITIVGHGFATADDVLVHVDTGGTLPTGLANTTRYFVRAVSADTLTLHDTAAHATANTDIVDITAAAVGNWYVDRDYPLTIHTFAGVKLVFYNGAVTRMPNVLLSTIKTLIGTVEFEAFLRNGMDWSNAAARWVITNEALNDTTFDPANILTQPYLGAWGATAPWSSFDTKEGFEFAPSMTLQPVTTDALGTVTRRLQAIEATVRAQPLGLDESQVLSKLLLQDAGSRRGRSLSGDDLNITGTGVYVRLYGAALRTAPQQFSAGLDRIGQLEWMATRTFLAGAPLPLFHVGTAAP